MIWPTAAGTIGYEVLTSLGPRYTRRYSAGAAGERRGAAGAPAGAAGPGDAGHAGRGRARGDLYRLQVGFAPAAPAVLRARAWHQLVQIGWLSLPVVGLTALFTGGALALQIYSGGARFQAEFAVPSIVAIGMVRELGPVLGGLMVAARVASSIAAELGTMKVTEQIDALVTLSTNPLKYLALPRVVAATLAVPGLVAVGDVIGIMGGWMVGTRAAGVQLWHLSGTPGSSWNPGTSPRAWPRARCSGPSWR
jgi:hypothetical protein